MSSFYNFLTEEQQVQVDVIFNFWNEFKGKGKPGTNIKFQSHNKLSDEITESIIENLKKYSLEEIFGAIENYAKVLLGEGTYWTHVWSLSVFLSVKEGKYKDAPKKWVQKFHSNNFVFGNFLKNSNGNQYNIIEDPDPKLTEEIIGRYKKLISSPDFVPNEKQKQQFTLTTVKMLDFYGKRKNIFRGAWIKYLFGCMWNNYRERSENCFPGHLCNDHTWNILMPQYLSELGMDVSE